MSEICDINYDQSLIDNDEVGELFLGNDPGKLKPKLFKQLVFPSHENE